MAAGVTTEWEDIQVKMGNWLPRPAVPTSEDIAQHYLEETEQIQEFQNRTTNQLKQMQEDKPDLEDDDDFLDAYRARRMEEIKKDHGKPRFGSQLEIQRPEFEIQVNRAPQDVIVVITLYQTYNAESLRLIDILDQVA